jgi:predicted permease
MLLGSLLYHRRAESDLGDEFEDHLNREIENNIRLGMSREEARYAAQRLVGPVALFGEECRDQRSTAFLETLARDLRYALQMIRRTPLFSAVAILTLAVGIGANTFIFTFVENVLLRSLPVSDPERLVSLNWGGTPNMSYPNYVTFRDQNSVFSELVASRVNIVNLSLRPRENFLAWGYEATGNYFQTLGIKPQLGRFFTPTDDAAPGAHPLIVIGDRYWRGHFAADPNVLGRAVKVNGYAFTIIGVAPPKFTGTELILACDFWVPMSMELEIEPGNDWYHLRNASNIWAMGRLKAGVSLAQAKENLDQIAKQLARSYPNDINPKARFDLSRPGLIGDALRKPATSFGIVLTILAALVLLLACTNLAGMLLARASDRHREIGIRLALGASRLRLLRQLMTESILLAVAGGAAGFGVAAVACSLFSSWRPAFDVPFNTTLRPDSTVLAFTLTLAGLATLAFGLTPALQSIRTDILPSLKDELIGGRLRHLRTRDILVIGQIALSVVLVICSALVVRGLQHALSLKLGYNPDRAVSISFDLRLKGYTPEQSRRFSAALLQKASEMPGFEAVGLTSNLPLRLDHGNNNIISRADRPVPKLTEMRSATLYNISPGYLRAAGTQLLSGRDFETRNRVGTPPVAIVNEALVHLLFPNENPLGKRLRLSMDASDKGLDIVGVVETGKYEYLGEDPHPAVFLPIQQTGIAWTTLVGRGPLTPRVATDLLRKAVLDLNPELSLSNAGSLKDQLALPLFPARMAALVLSLFGLLAMVLAATGLFALVAYAVAQRTREIGIRMALGARSGQVLAAIFRRTIVLCAAGISIGAICTLFASRLLSSVLYGISPHDPTAYVSALLLMIAVSLLACWNPASRAIRTDPARTLRAE